MNWKSVFSKFNIIKKSTDNIDDFNPWLPLQIKLKSIYKLNQACSGGYLMGKPIDRPPNLWWIAESLIPEFEQSCTTVLHEFDGNVEWSLFIARDKRDRFFLRIAPKSFQNYLEKPLSSQDFQELQQKYPRLNKFSYIHIREQEFGAAAGSFCSEALADVPKLVELLLKTQF